MLVGTDGRPIQGDVAMMILDECIRATMKVGTLIKPEAERRGDKRVMKLVKRHLQDLIQARESAKKFFDHVSKK